MISNTFTAAAVLAAAVLPSAFAQTFTDCSPLQKSCPSDAGLAAAVNTDFTQGHDGWSNLNAGASFGSSGAVFTITADGQAPTIQTDGYLFFGHVDVVAQTAPGVGIVSAIVLESDDLDEIDWEFLGGAPTDVQTNFFGKGDTSSYDRVAHVAIANSQTSFHTYSLDWTSDRIQWLVDGTVVRTLAYSDALAAGGKLYPQTPCRVKIGSWVGGGAGNSAGTVQWAGGKTDFSQAPFVMTVKSVSITNYNPASSYTYSDQSGNWQSITMSGAFSNKGNSSPSNSAPAGYSSSAIVPSSAAPVVQSSSAAPVVQSSSTTIPIVQSSLTTSTSSQLVTSKSAVIVAAPPVSATAIQSSTSTRAAGVSSISTGAPLSFSVTASSQATSATSSARPSYTGAAVALQAGTIGSLAGVAAAMLML